MKVRKSREREREKGEKEGKRKKKRKYGKDKRKKILERICFFRMYCLRYFAQSQSDNEEK